MSEIPEVGASGADPYGVGAIGAVVSSGISDVTSVISQYFGNQAADPCERLLHFEGYLDSWVDTLLEVEGRAAEAVAALDLARQRFLRSWGMDPRAQGTESFPMLIDRATTWGPGPYPPLVWAMDVVSLLPPDGFAPPPLLADTGYSVAPQVAAGVYLTPVGLAGWKLVELWQSWRAAVAEQVGPTEWPRWAVETANLVGSVSWRPGDPAGGYLGELRALVAELTALRSELAAECDRFRAEGWNLAGRGEREHAQEQTTRRVFAAAAVLVAALLKKGRKR